MELPHEYTCKQWFTIVYNGLDHPQVLLVLVCLWPDPTAVENTAQNLSHNLQYRPTMSVIILMLFLHCQSTMMGRVSWLLDSRQSKQLKYYLVEGTGLHQTALQLMISCAEQWNRKHDPLHTTSLKGIQLAATYSTDTNAMRLSL